ncbi:MAG TPA: CBS domain-containing protein [Natronosporangium sp.]
MRARDLAETYPIVTLDTPALAAAQRLARERLSGLVVVDGDNRPLYVLPATQVLGLGVPGYARDDPALARVIDEAHADAFLRELDDRTIADYQLRRDAELPVVTEDDTVLEIAALMARTRTPVIPVVDGAGAMVGAITLHRLLDRVLSR